MRIIGRVLMAGAVAAGTLVPAAFGFEVSGTVKDRVGKPVPNVRVTIAGDDLVPTTTTVFTTADGTFRAPKVNAAYDGNKIEISTFRIGFEEDARKLTADKNGNVILDAILRTKRNVADQVPASAWFPGKAGDRDLHITINECAGCHQLAAARVKTFASSLDGLSVADKAEAWKAMVQYMREQALEMGPSGHSEPRWGLTRESPDYKAAITPDGSFFRPQDEKIVVEFLSKKFPTSFETYTNYDEVKRLGAFGVNAKTVIEEFKLPSYGWTREVSIVPGSKFVWFLELDKDRLGRLDPSDGSVTWVDVPGKGPQGPHTLNADADGGLWAALEESYSIGRYDPKTDKWRIYPPPKGVKFAITHDTAFNSMRHVQPDFKGRIWLTLVGLNELWSVDIKTAAVERFRMPLPPDQDLFNVFLYGTVMEPSRKRVWFTQLHGFLGSFNVETETVETIVPFPYGAAPRRMAIEESGILWVPLYGDGQVVKFDTEARKILATYDMPDRGGASYSVTLDPKRKAIWIGTTNSDRIYRFDIETEKWRHYPLPRAEAFIRMLEIDHETGDLWTAYSNLPIGPRDPETYGKSWANNMIVRIHPGD